jgi:hypothetical protein
MRKLFCFLSASVLCLTSISFAQSDGDPEAFINIGVTPAGTFTYPVRDFGENYRDNWGGGLKVNLNMDALRGKLGLNLGLLGYYDQFKVRGQNENASLTTIALNMDIYLFYVTSGMTLGAGRFQVGDNVFNGFGGNTGTELGDENKEWQMTSSRYFGFRVPVGKWVAIDCNYHLVSTERAWMFWHSLISGTIEEIPIAICDGIADNFVKQDKVPAAIIAKLVGIGFSWAWYYFDYNHHNWPWNDSKPLRYQRIAVGTTILFGHWDQSTLGE